MQFNLWVDMFHKYKNVAFDYHGGQWSQLRRANPKQFCKHLFLIEPKTVQTENWNPNIVNNYSTFITWNKKFLETCDFHGKSFVTDGGIFTDNIHGGVSNFTSYEDKIKGVVVLGQTGHRMTIGNIYFLRVELLDNLSRLTPLVTHMYSYSKDPDNPHYQGRIEGSPWVASGVEKVNEYLFCFCPENTYHPLWSYGYLCEKIFRAFKAKTVPIYIGAYNVEDYIPKDLFIDFRDFYVENPDEAQRGVSSNSAYAKLAYYLMNFPKEKYIEMTEKAYAWEKTRTMGRIDKVEAFLETLE